MSDRPDSFFTMYGGDFLRDTMHLNTRQSGAYQLLLIHYYGKGAPLPLDDEQIRSITREQPSEWKIDRSIVMAFFTHEVDGWHQKRADKELAGMKVRYERAVKGGKAKQASSRRKAGHKQPHKQPTSSEQAPAYDLLNGSKPDLSSLTGKESLVARAAARDGDAAPPGHQENWEQNYEKWAQVREKIGGNKWSLWFQNCRLNGSETSLVTPSAYEADRIRDDYGAMLNAHFGTEVTIKPEAK